MKAILKVKTGKRTELTAVTAAVGRAVAQWGDWSGMVYVFSPHTTAGVTINEQYDPDVARDIEMEMAKLVPWNDGYAHAEGNSGAHIRTMLTGNGVWVPVRDGRLDLGRWQGIWFCEFDGPRERELWVVPMPGGPL